MGQRTKCSCVGIFCRVTEFTNFSQLANLEKLDCNNLTSSMGSAI